MEAVTAGLFENLLLKNTAGDFEECTELSVMNHRNAFSHPRFKITFLR